jgi:hypothetical protein
MEELPFRFWIWDAAMGPVMLLFPSEAKLCVVSGWTLLIRQKWH